MIAQIVLSLINQVKCLQVTLELFHNHIAGDFTRGTSDDGQVEVYLFCFQWLGEKMES